MEYMPWKATEWFGHRLLVPLADPHTEIVRAADAPQIV